MLDHWEQLPDGLKLGSSIGVEVDHSDGKSLWVFDRCGNADSCDGSKQAPIWKFDPSGKVVANFGSGMFNVPHGFYVDKSGNVWVIRRGRQGRHRRHRDEILA